VNRIAAGNYKHFINVHIDLLPLSPTYFIRSQIENVNTAHALLRAGTQPERLTNNFALSFNCILLLVPMILMLLIISHNKNAAQAFNI
jgi:hypothetical protein